MRRLSSLGRTVILLAIGSTSWLTAHAMPSGMIFDIGAGPAAASLKEFATQAHLQLLFDFKAVEKLKTRAVRGQLTPIEALQEMLEGSGFTFHEINDHTIAIARLGGSSSSVELQQQGSPSTDGKKEGKTESSLGSLQAQEGSGQSSSTATVEAKAEVLSKSPPLQEVIVTAEKRSGQLLSVPVPVTALNADELEDYNQLRVQDYFDQVPGLQIFPSAGHGTPQIAVRGIIAGQGLNPTVGVTIDGVQYGSSTNNGGGNVIPDIDPSELARIEVLKGPQGTLYGSNSLGGLLQYVTVDPSTDAFSGRAQVGGSDVQNGAHAGYNARAAVNIPIDDTLAVRVSGFTRRDPGYIDDVTHGVSGVNQQDVYGGRFAALWKPTDNFSAKFAALLQHQEQFGADYADNSSGMDLSDLQQSGRVFNTGIADTQIGNYSLTLSYKVSTFDLTSISAYSTNKVYDRLDESILGALNNALVPAVTDPLGDTVGETVETRKYSQELRLASPLSSKIDWLFGLYYTKETSRSQQDIEVADQLIGVSLLPFEYNNIPSAFEEYALFTDFTFKISDRFDVQVGGRDSEDRESYSIFTMLNPALGPASLAVPPDSRNNTTTYLVTPRYTVFSNGTDNVMTYARFASGFRPGGPTGSPAGSGAPLTYGPDKTSDYDLGLKADLLNSRLFVDLSLFYIDWRNIQFSEIVGTIGTIANGNSARSTGAELQTEMRPLPGLVIDVNYAYDDATLRQDLSPSPTAFALDGDRLPFSAKHTAHLKVNQDIPLFGPYRGSVGGELSYIGNREGLFAVSAAAPRQEYAAYTQANVRAGVTYNNTYSVDAYVTNVTNRRGVLSGGLSEVYPLNSYLYITPRTVGVELSTTF